MDAERARAFLLSLPHAVETQQWGNNLVFWVGDKAVGGKMFCLLNLDYSGRRGAGSDDVASATDQLILSYAAGPERYSELLEREGFHPAPYLARIFWVAVGHWNALRNAEWEEELRAAHGVVFAKLPRRTRDVLAMPAREQTQLITARQRLLATRKAAGSDKQDHKGKR